MFAETEENLREDYFIRVDGDEAGFPFEVHRTTAIKGQRPKHEKLRCFETKEEAMKWMQPLKEDLKNFN